MIDEDALADCLRDIGADTWMPKLSALINERVSENAHGDFARWRAAINSLPGATGNPDAIKAALQKLSPWRKGPFDVGGVNIDSEWRCDMKWARLADAIEPLADKNVLDVGCGNGYYALRMRDAGAANVIGIDPTLLYVMQFLAINHFIQDPHTFVLPLRLNEMCSENVAFDTVFSMGVLYHQRSPVDHLRQLRTVTKPGGQLILETLFLPGDDARAFTPPDRYARMKNVWLLPTVPELTTWITRCGFANIAIIDTARTTTREQRSTEWMTFESLAESLHPDDPMRTIEGWPAPHRVVVTATRVN
ncbi:MAG: tRNA 5-methoxyuridine(34)/uridine 5-oxyacetic acid(34) synthase CmoB [Woeseiaceae bacterium]|nr:tRNA 5-methoxyuridine(34)/uridine 5-oxyacetic acid(34) synthase CmoB [Woeseiaceae bacterium]